MTRSEGSLLPAHVRTRRRTRPMTRPTRRSVLRKFANRASDGAVKKQVSCFAAIIGSGRSVFKDYNPLEKAPCL